MNSLYKAELKYMQPANMLEPKLLNLGIRDGREFDNPGWEKTGFELVDFPSAVTDWQDEQMIQDRHYDEVIERAKAMTGCDIALVSGHILRNPEQEKVHSDLGPIQFVHSDFAPSYHNRLKQHYASGNAQTDEAMQKAGITAKDMADAKRMVILQFWRNVGEEVMDLPLAMCDARTVAPNEIVPIPVSDYAGGGFDFEALGIAAPEDDHHAWYVFPHMNRDEAIAFRTFDSALVGDGAFWTPHSAIRDPAVSVGEPARYSIELRATCLYF